MEPTKAPGVTLFSEGLPVPVSFQTPSVLLTVL